MRCEGASAAATTLAEVTGARTPAMNLRKASASAVASPLRVARGAPAQRSGVALARSPRCARGPPLRARVAGFQSPRRYASCYWTSASLNQDPFPVFDTDDDTGTIVHAVVISGTDAEYAVACGNVLGILQRVAQRAAKRLAARLSFFQCLGNSALQQQVCVPRVAAKGRAAAGRVLRFVRLDVFSRRLLDRVAVRQLLVDEQWAGGKHAAVAVGTDDAKEVGVGNAMRLIDLSLVAARNELLVRRCRRSPGAGDQHRVGLRSKDFQHLTGDARIVPVVFFLGDDLDARGLCRALDLPQPAIAVGIGKADEAHGAHAIGAHMDCNRVGHQDRKS